MKKIILLTGGSGMVGKNIKNHKCSSDYEILSPTSSDLNLLKSGEISEQEYYNRRANLLSGTELMISGANNFNKNYDGC